MILIPAIDLRNGRCVRLFQGDFSAETRYDYDPSHLLTRYRDLGASWLHIVDLDGAKDGTLANRSIITTLAVQAASSQYSGAGRARQDAEPERPWVACNEDKEVVSLQLKPRSGTPMDGFTASRAGVLTARGLGTIQLQVGGGVRSTAALEDLLQHKVSRVVVGSLAVESPDEVADWLHRYGPEQICLAFDVRLDETGVPRVRTRGWTEATSISLWDAVRRLSADGLKHVLCTDIERDGALTGPNVELYREAVSRFPNLAWQASGGIRNAFDLAGLAQTGVAGAVSGKALLEQRITSEELRPFLQDASSLASMSATAKL